MTEPHCIRLRGPWRYEPLWRHVRQPDGKYCESSEGLPPPGKSLAPADWSLTLGPDFRGCVRYLRVFHRPSGLSKCETVWLVVGGVRTTGAVMLNDQPLGVVRGVGESVRFEVTELLRDDNVVIIEVTQLVAPEGVGGDLPGGLIGEVRLEIDSVPRTF